MKQLLTRNALSELGGYLGIILIQGATIPTTLGVILGHTKHLPPLSMVLLVWSGLALFFWRAYEKKDRLYMLSNGLGFFLNSVLLALIVFKGA